MTTPDTPLPPHGPPERPAGLDARVLSFARALRAEGLLLGPGEVTLALEALTSGDLGDREEVRLMLRSVFAKSPLEQAHFDRLFDRFFRPAGEPPRPMGPQLRLQRPPPRKSFSLLDWEQRGAPEGEVRTMRYSPARALAQRDFAAVRSDEVAALQQLVGRLAKRLATRLARRERLEQLRRRRIDIRRTLRRNLAHGGEPLELGYRGKRRERTRLVFLFDISGSMQPYSQFLLQLAYAFVRQRQVVRCEVFGFGTDLYRLTELLRLHGVREALTAASLAMPGRAGGTRIGASLRSFLEQHGHQLDDRAVVVIASDGWDTGELTLLEQTMATLSRRARQLIWLNPLAGHPGYQPTAGGMRTALPYLDLLAPAHNLESLRALEQRLGRPGRRQR